MLILLLIAMSDFILQTTVVAVLPNQASRQVTFTFHVDSIAQELDETVRLRLQCLNQYIIDLMYSLTTLCSFLTQQTLLLWIVK